MLQAIRDKAQGWIAWAIVILISIPFALWGIQEYLGVGAEPTAAVVDGEKITQRMLDQRLRDFRESLRYSLGDSYSPDLFDDNELRPQVLDAMIEEIVLSGAAQDWNLRTSAAQARAFIASIPAFQRDGRFDAQLYEATVRNRGVGAAGFEQGVLRDLAVEQLRSGVRNSAFLTDSELADRVRLSREQRIIRYLRIPAEHYRGAVVADATAVEDFYRQNPQRYRMPERVKLSYLVLDAADLGALVEVEDGALRQYFEDHRAEFIGLEERAVQHILIAARTGDDEQLAQARERAEALLAELRAGADFAEVARTHSEDPGSAANGGDLGWVEPGLMVPDFERAAFSLGKGELSEVVQTEFGFHIIKVSDIRGGSGAGFEELRDQVESAYRRFEAENLYFDYAERLAESAYENSDSLIPAAETLGLQVQTTDWLERDGVFPAPLDSPRVAGAVFSDDVLLERHNSELIETGQQRAVVVRVAEYEPAGLIPLEQNRAAVEADYVMHAAAAEAARLGAELLGRLEEGAGSLAELASLDEGYVLHEPGAVGRMQADLPAELLSVVFGLEPPAADGKRHAGVQTASGDYILLELAAVEPGQLAAMPPAERERFARAGRDALAEIEMGYVTQSLRDAAKVEVEALRTEEP